LIEDIDGRRLFLPHIQRPFVWTEEQMRRLFDSLMRKYPIQTVLFWRTKDFIKARKFMTCIDRDTDLHLLYDEQKSVQGVEKVFVLDGQQRLQTLYALFNGEIMDDDGHKRDAYVDLTAGDTPNPDGLIYDVKFSPTPEPLPYYHLRDLMGKDATKNAEEIAEEINEALDQQLPEELADQRKDRQKRVRRNASQIRALLKEEQYFWVQQLDGVADAYPYKTILDIFVRVNSGGTKLDAGDLMFAAMKEGWAEVEEKVEEVANLLSNGKLDFDKSFVLKCLVLAHGRDAELTPEKFSSDKGGKDLLDEIEQHWQTAEDAFQQLRDFIQHDLQLYSPTVVRSYGSFIPLFDYLYRHAKPDPANRARMRAYYYKAQLFNWFGRSTDGTLNTLHRTITKAPDHDFPLSQITAQFATRLSTELRPHHLEQARLRTILLNILYVEAFAASPFNVMFKGNDPQADHIYARSPLSTKLNLPSSEINDLGNFRFIGAADNLRKRAELPGDYFTRLKNAGVPIERHLLLPEFAANPAFLKFDVPTYRDFRDRRRAKIFQILRRVVDLTDEPVEAQANAPALP
jgi:predicted nucleotidyltransferase